MKRLLSMFPAEHPCLDLAARSAGEETREELRTKGKSRDSIWGRDRPCSVHPVVASAAFVATELVPAGFVALLSGQELKQLERQAPVVVLQQHQSCLGTSLPEGYPFRHPLGCPPMLWQQLLAICFFVS